MASIERRFHAHVEGVEVHWVEIGAGRPLVLLHGLSDSHRTWRLVAPALAAGRRVIMPDLPGHGLSGRPDATYELAWFARIMGAWIDAIGLADIDLVGHSFGGGVAQFLLLERRERVRRLGLVSSGGLGDDVSVGLRLLSLPGIVERFGQPLMGPVTRVAMRTVDASFDADDIAWLAWANAMPGSARALGRTVRDVIDWRGQRRHFLDRAGEISGLPPTALYWGDRDPVIPIAHAADFDAIVDGVALTRFEGCGHFPHRERPDVFTRSLIDFLDVDEAHPVRLRRTLVAVPASRRKSLAARMWSAVKRAFRRRTPRARVLETHVPAVSSPL